MAPLTGYGPIPPCNRFVFTLSLIVSPESPGHYAAGPSGSVRDGLSPPKDPQPNRFGATLTRVGDHRAFDIRAPAVNPQLAFFQPDVGPGDQVKPVMRFALARDHLAVPITKLLKHGDVECPPEKIAMVLFQRGTGYIGQNNNRE